MMTGLGTIGLSLVGHFGCPGFESRKRPLGKSQGKAAYNYSSPAPRLAGAFRQWGSSIQEPIMSQGAGSQSQNSQPDQQIVRRTANYHPCIWGDRFMNYDLDAVTYAHQQEEVEELKGAVRREVFKTSTADDVPNQMKLIDAIQRLGIAYHFEKEIEEALEHIYATYHFHDEDDGDLYEVSLAFRLLRQHGHNISSGIFNKFKDTGNGGFKDSLVADVPGMLSFYEACHLRVHGDDILEEALAFTTAHLESATAHVSCQLAGKIAQSLERPLRKDIVRLCARRYMSIYQNEASHNEALLKLAKLDFNLVQSLHKKELSEIRRWWKEIDFKRKMPFARDRIVELHFAIVGVYFEPQFHVVRKMNTKISALFSVMDDIYDAFATFEELVKFTEAIQRWDVKCMDGLPECMHIFYHTLLNLFNEIEEEKAKEGRAYQVYYLKEAWKLVAKAYFDEAKWLNEGYVPSMEEYMSVATASGGNPILVTMALVAMGDIVTKESFEWLFTNPKVNRASCTIGRLMDDIVTSKFEQERGHTASSIDCYMKQYGASEQETIDVFNKQIVESWKDLNKEFLRPTAMSMPILMPILNLTRVVDLLYKKDDGYTRVGKVMKDSVASCFIDPAPL